MDQVDQIEEGSSRLLGGHSVAGSSNDYRWVDGSEVDSESPPWSLLEERESGEGYGSVRRRLVKKPKRVDSFDVEAMEIADTNYHHLKVYLLSVLNLELFNLIIVDKQSMYYRQFLACLLRLRLISVCLVCSVLHFFLGLVSFSWVLSDSIGAAFCLWVVFSLPLQSVVFAGVSCSS